MGECALVKPAAPVTSPEDAGFQGRSPVPPRTMAAPTPTLASIQTSDAPFVLADHKGVVLAINPAFEQVYGWSEAELVGTPSDQSFPHG